MFVNFTHFSPSLECKIDRGNSILKNSLDIKYFNLYGANDKLRGYANGYVSFEEFDKKPVNLNCLFTYDSKKDNNQDEIIHLALITPRLPEVSPKQPHFFNPGDQDRLRCQTYVNVQCKYLFM